jgi:hypothetical protein
MLTSFKQVSSRSGDWQSLLRQLSSLWFSQDIEVRTFKLAAYFQAGNLCVTL